MFYLDSAPSISSHREQKWWNRDWGVEVRGAEKQVKLSRAKLDRKM